MKPVHSMLALCILLTGCGGGTKGNDPIKVNDNSTDAPGSVLTKTALLAPGPACQNGGITIDIGIDSNKDGVLNPDEISETKQLCHGESGYSSLIKIDNEAPGVNCSSGGKAIKVGRDVNRNNTLESFEVDDTQYVCNGTAGTNGVDGIDNSAIAGIYCFGSLENTSLFATYSATQLNSGDVIASASVADSYVEVSKTVYYSSLQNGYTNAPVVFTFDVGGDFYSSGYWYISLNRNTLVTTLTYTDTDTNNGDPMNWYWAADQCTVNNYN